MSGKVDIERTLSAWFAEGPTTMPDGVTDVVGTRIAGVRQRNLRMPWLSRPSYRPWRLTPMVAAASTLVVAAAFGFGLFAGGIIGPARPTMSPPMSPVFSGAAPPAGTPSQRPTTAPSEAPGGTHTSEVWVPKLTYALPAGWTMTADRNWLFSLAKTDHPVTSIELLWNAHRVQQFSSLSPLAGTECWVGNVEWNSVETAFTLANYVALTRLEQATTSPVTVGGLEGWKVEGVVPPRPMEPCTRPPLYQVRDDGGGGAVGSALGEAGTLTSFTALDDTNGHVIVLKVSDPGSRWTAEIASIVDSFQFQPGPVPSPTPSSDDQSHEDQPLPPGTYTSQIWAPAVTYTVPSGWTTGYEGPDWMSIYSDGRSIELDWNAYPNVLSNDGCGIGADWSAPHTAFDLVQYLADPGMENARVSPTSLGGLDGWTVTGIVPEVPEGCYDRPLWVVRDVDGRPYGRWGIPNEETTVIVLDDRHGHAVAIISFGEGVSAQEEIADIIASFEFDTRCSTVRHSVCNEPADGVAQVISSGDGRVTVTVPDQGLLEPGRLTVSGPLHRDYPDELAIGYDLDYRVIGPPDATFVSPVSVDMQATYRSADMAGATYYTGRETGPWPVYLLAVRTSDGRWDWLSDLEVSYGREMTGRSSVDPSLVHVVFYAETTGTSYDPGQLFAFNGGVYQSGQWEPAPGASIAPVSTACESGFATVTGLGAGDPTLEALGLGPTSARVKIDGSSSPC